LTDLGLESVLWGNNKEVKAIPKEDLGSASKDPDYLRHYDVVLSRFRKEIGEKGCDILESTIDLSRPIAYFSAEYGLHRSLPFYAGGLGFWPVITLRNVVIWGSPSLP
jgi:starch phosphorylase